MKKIKSIIVLFSLLSTFVPHSIRAVELNEVLGEHEIGLLSAISFIREDGYSTNEYITRAEFANMVSGIMCYDGLGAVDMPFRDIDASHPGYRAISVLYGKGVIKGTSKYSVAPDERITLAEASKIVVCSLGYSQVADTQWANAYPLAVELGLFDGISASPNATITEADATKLLYNALFAPVMYVKYSEEGAILESNQELILLNEVYDIYEVEGIITENAVTSLYAPGTLAENQVRLGNAVYTYTYADAPSYLGSFVHAFVYSTDGVDTDGNIVYAYEKDSKCKRLIIQSMDIDSVESNQITYTVGSSTKRAKLSLAMDVIYNGIGTKERSIERLNPYYGELTLIDNNADGAYDVAFVTEYQRVVVQSISVTDNDIKISDKYANNLNISLSSQDVVVHVYRGENAATPQDIKSGSVLLVADSGLYQGARYVEIFMLQDKTNGVLTGLDDKLVTVDKTSIPITPFVSQSSILSYVSSKVTCYRDMYSRVAYLEIESTNNYAFLYNIAYDEDTEEVSVKLLGTDNEWYRYKLNKRVTNNTQVYDDKVLYNSLVTNGSTDKQLIRFELDSKGNVRTLDTAAFSLDGTTVNKETDDALRDKGYFRKSLAYEERRYAHMNKGLFIGKGYDRWLECFFSDNLVVLLRPDSNEFGEKDVHFYTSSYFKTDHDYYTEGYDLNEENYINAVVVYGSTAATVQSSDRFTVVDKFGTTMEDGVRMYNLFGYSAGTYTTYRAESDNVYTIDKRLVKQGDIVRVAKDFGGLATSLEPRLWFSPDNAEAYFTDYESQGATSSDAYGYNQIAIGRVSKVFGKYLRIEVQNQRYINVMLSDSAGYIVYDKSQRSTLSKGASSDIVVGDVVVARMYFGRLDDLIIYKGI